MKLETVEQRHKFIEDMVSKAFEIEEGLIPDSEHQDDWGGAMTTAENIVKVEEFIRTEQILLDTLGEMVALNTADNEGKKIFLNIANEGFNEFLDMILMSELDNACVQLARWEFATADGGKLKKTFCRKFDTLMKTYQDLYDL